MAASKKFTPRASANLIEGEVTNAPADVEETEVVAPTDDVEVTPTVAPTDDIKPEPTVDESNNPTEDNEEDSAEDKKANEVTFTAQTDKKPIERMVKICLAKKYDGCIGGTWYHFEKNQVVSVPENVKRILNSNEGMLKPL